MAITSEKLGLQPQVIPEIKGAFIVEDAFLISKPKGQRQITLPTPAEAEALSGTTSVNPTSNSVQLPRVVESVPLDLKQENEATIQSRLDIGFGDGVKDRMQQKGWGPSDQGRVGSALSDLFSDVATYAEPGPVVCKAVVGDDTVVMRLQWRQEKDFELFKQADAEAAFVGAVDASHADAYAEALMARVTAAEDNLSLGGRGFGLLIVKTTMSSCREGFDQKKKTKWVELTLNRGKDET
jgi:hypothetical protein